MGSSAPSEKRQRSAEGRPHQRAAAKAQAALLAARTWENRKQKAESGTCTEVPLSAFDFQLPRHHS